jgi:hypothetical protein
MNIYGQLHLGTFGGKLRGLFRRSLFTFGIVISVIVPANAVLKGDLELLKFTAMTHKDNRARIHTWQGHAQIETSQRDANGVMMKQTSSAVFLIDHNQEAKRWKWTPIESWIRMEDKLVLDKRSIAEEGKNEMAKGDAFYVYAPGYKTKEGETRNALVIWPEGKGKARKQSYYDSFDPMWYLTGHMTKCTDDLPERLMFYYREANNPELSEGTVTRDGDLVVLEVRSDDLLNRHEFDLSKGGNVVKYYAESPLEGTELREWTYEQKEGVWIPKTFALEIKEWQSPDSRDITSRIRKVTFVENTLNRPIPASEFSLEKLGVKVGDRVTDRIMGLSYVYGGSEKFPLEDEDLFLKETPANQAKPSVQSAMEAEAKTLTNEQLASDDASSEQPILGQAEQTGRPNHAKWFVIGLVAFGISALVSFMLLRKHESKEDKASESTP